MDNEIETASEERGGLESFTEHADSNEKSERKYELQRKIDEELRKLQLEQQMDTEEEIQESTHAETHAEQKGGYADAGSSASAEHDLIDDDKLDYNADLAVNRSDSDTIFVSKELIQQPSAANEIDISATMENGENGVKLNGIYPPDSTETENEQSNIDSRVTKLVRSETASSNDLLDSSGMTSPTTTAGTYTLPPCSPGTEGDVNEVAFPVDQIPPTFRDHHLDGVGSSPSPQEMDISQASSNVFFAHDQNMKTSPPVDANGLQEMPNQNDEHSNELQTNIKVSSPTGGGCEPVDSAMQEDTTKVEIAEKDSGEEEIEMQASEAPLSDARTQYDITTEDIPSISIGGDELVVIAEQNDNSHAISENRDVPADMEFRDQMEQREPALEESFNRKISTDEDDYSGYDVDVCDPSSYQEEISIADSEEQSRRVSFEPIRQACDADNVPYFIDGQYSVEQVGGEGTYYEPPEPSYDENDPQIAPWDVVHHAGDLSLSTGSHDPPIDTSSSKSGSYASSRGGSHSSSESVDPVHQKIAIEIVDAAIKSAYETTTAVTIAENEGDMPFDEVQSENDSDTPATPPPENSWREEGASFGTANQIEENAACQTNEIEIITTANDYDPLTAEYEQTDASYTREYDDVIRTTASIEEKEPHSQITEVASGSVDETAENNVAEFSHSPEAELEVGESLSSSDNTARIERTRSDSSSSGNSVKELLEDLKESAALQAQVDSDTSSIPERQGTEDQDTETHELIESEVANQEDMVRVRDESPSKTRHFPERITYNPALSQRNTEATKWFGQPTAENKIWMKPSGKVDENAELERRKLIKSMTRRHNPNLVPKWQPPKEKDFAEDLDAKQKASLQRYEARRRSKSEVGETKISPVEQPTIAEEPATAPEPAPDMATTESLQTRENIVIESVVHSRDAISVWETRLSEKQRKEALEKKRLSVGKLKKRRERANTDIARQRHDSSSSVSSNASGVLPTSEYIERESMNVSQVRNRWRNIEEESSKAKSPTNFQKETGSGIRSSSFSVNTGPAYRSFQRPTASAVKSKVKKEEREIHGGPIVIHSLKNESFIDREIREAAEREERWKQEQWEKMSEVSAASSEEVFPDNIPKPSKDPRVITTIYTRSLPMEDVVGIDIMKDADREELWKEEHSPEKISRKKGSKSSRNTSKDSSGMESALSADIIVSPTARSPGNHASQKDADSESLSSYGSSITGNGIASPPPVSKTSNDKVEYTKPKSSETAESPNAMAKQQDATDSGIECNIVPVQEVSKAEKAPKVNGLTATAANDTEDPAAKEKEEQTRRQRLASLTNVVAPKGWEPSKTRSNSAVSPVSPIHRSVPKPEAKSQKTAPDQAQSLPPVSEQPIMASDATIVSFVPPQFEEPGKTEADEVLPVKSDAKVPKKDESVSNEDELGMTELIGVLEEKVEKKNVQKHKEPETVTTNHVEATPAVEAKEKRTPPAVQIAKPSFKPAEKKGPQFTHQKTGPSFEVTSSKSRLETIMEREMREAMEREEEWRKKQLEQVKQGVDVSPQHIVHSTREIRTPTTAAPPPPVNVGEPVLMRREVKSLFAEDSIINAPYIHEDSSDEYKKRAVVKAMRVPRRKSTMAMQWEKGDFQNNVPEED